MGALETVNKTVFTQNYLHPQNMAFLRKLAVFNTRYTVAI
jgi:hypothetical protein